MLSQKRVSGHLLPRRVPPEDLLDDDAEWLAVRHLLAILTATGLVHTRDDSRDQFVT
jgi:hypothetical protein